MKRIVLVTSRASNSVLSRYLDADFAGLDEGIDICKEAGVRLTFAITDFSKVQLDNLLSYIPKDRIMKYETNDDRELAISKVVSFLFSRGWEEVIILDSFSGNLRHTHELLLLLKSSKGHVMVHDDNNLVTYYSKGSHVITKQGFSTMSIFGFPKANVSMEHVSKSVKNVEITFEDSHALVNTFFERVAVLKVNEGGVLLVLSD